MYLLLTTSNCTLFYTNKTFANVNRLSTPVFLKSQLLKELKEMCRKGQPPSAVYFLVTAGRGLFCFEIVHRATNFPTPIHRGPILPHTQALNPDGSLAVSDDTGLFRYGLLNFLIRVRKILFQPILALIAKEKETLEGPALGTRSDRFVLFDRPHRTPTTASAVRRSSVRCRRHYLGCQSVLPSQFQCGSVPIATPRIGAEHDRILAHAHCPKGNGFLVLSMSAVATVRGLLLFHSDCSFL